uniref:Uncharacterized protein n=1 Tax=viral metagenome TaxID=1070528 RepID=A0A6C0M206_9ZZZZ
MQSLLLSVVQQLSSKYSITNSEEFVADMCAILFTTTADAEPAAEKPKSKSKAKAKPEPAPEAEAAPAPVEDKKEAAKRKAAETRARNKAAKEAAAKEAPAPVDEPKKEVNVAKLTPTLKKHLKKGLEDHRRELTTQVEKEFLDFLNSMSNADYKKEKKHENFVKIFLTPRAEAAAAIPLPEEPEEMTQIVFKGKTYWVGDNTKKVFYDPNDEEGCEFTARNLVGDFGMNEFKDMVWPEEEEE